MMKNKDGTPYKCTTPNPILKTQEWINDFILHNCKWREIQSTQQIKGLPKDIVKQIEIEPEPEPEIELEIPDPEPEIPIIEIVDRALEKPITYEDAVLFHCLPIVDDKYGEPFDFEGLIYSEDDLVFVFWTNNQLSKGSIIYPYKYSVKKKQYPGYRWWKVTECKQHRIGYFIYTFLSEDCPDFT